MATRSSGCPILCLMLMTAAHTSAVSDCAANSSHLDMTSGGDNCACDAGFFSPDGGPEYVQVSGAATCQPYLDGIYAKNANALDGRPTYTKAERQFADTVHMLPATHIFFVQSLNSWYFGPAMAVGQQSPTPEARFEGDLQAVPLENWDHWCNNSVTWEPSQIVLSVFPVYSCEQCPAGKFKEMAGNIECEVCPATQTTAGEGGPGNQTTAGEGSTSVQNCSCAPGLSPTYVEQAVVSGQDDCQVASHGVYTRNGALYNARPTYSKYGPPRHIYYVLRPSYDRYLWVISDTIGNILFNAISLSNSTTVPLQNWRVSCGNGFVESNVGISVQTRVDMCAQPEADEPDADSPPATDPLPPEPAADLLPAVTQKPVPNKGGEAGDAKAEGDALVETVLMATIVVAAVLVLSVGFGILTLTPARGTRCVGYHHGVPPAQFQFQPLYA